jgi:hypothetical protein
MKNTISIKVKSFFDAQQLHDELFDNGICDLIDGLELIALNELEEVRLSRHHFFVSAVLDNLSILKKVNTVVVFDGLHSVSDAHCGYILELLIDILHQSFLGLSI